MATTRTTVSDLRRDVRDAYRSGREMGLTHEESVRRAVELVRGLPRVTIEQWCGEANR